MSTQANIQHMLQLPDDEAEHQSPQEIWQIVYCSLGKQVLNTRLSFSSSYLFFFKAHRGKPDQV